MLPTVKTAQRNLIASITALTLALPAAPAMAWGDKEQSFVAGVVTAVIVEELIKNNKARRAAPPQYVYVEPAPIHTPSAISIYNTPAARAFQSYSLAERKAIQRNLRAWGYYHGGIDGSFGPGTYNAVVAYARDAGFGGSLGSTGGAYGIYDGLIF
jgi:hypothetical protein